MNDNEATEYNIFDESKMTKTTPYILNETDAFTVNESPEGLTYYTIEDGVSFRTHLAELFGEDSPEYLESLATPAVPEGMTARLTADFRVQFDDEDPVTLWEATGKAEGPITDARDGDPLAVND